MITKISKRAFTQLAKQSNMISVNELNKEIQEKQEALLKEAEKTGADLSLPSELKSTLQKSGVFVEDFRSDSTKDKSLYYHYLRNMGLIIEYQNIFRDFLQSIARQDNNYLDLVCESSLGDYINQNIDIIRKKGFIIELENLKIKQDFSVIDWKLYKNLRVRREDNTIPFKFDHYANKKVSIARFIGEDKSIYDNEKPIVLSSTLKVRTPMKLSVFNQNFTKKVFGKSIDDQMEYTVKFETELSYTDLLWILPTPNKPSRLRQTRIVDFNNIMNGNEFKELNSI